MLKCEEVLNKMSDYIDNYLPENEKIQFEDHMKSCKSCEKEFDDLEKIILKLKNIEDIEPPAHLKDSIMASIKLEEKNSKNNIVVFKRYSSLVATLLVFVIGAYVVNFSPMLESQSRVKRVQTSDSSDDDFNNIDNNENINNNNSMMRGIITEDDQVNPIGNSILSTTKDIPNNISNEILIADMPDDNFSIDPNISIANNDLEFFGKTLFKEENLNSYSHKIDFMQGQLNYKISFVNSSENTSIIKFKDESQNNLFEKVIVSGYNINFYIKDNNFTIQYVHELDMVEYEEFIITQELQDIIYYVVIEAQDNNNILEGTFKIQEIDF